MGDLLNGTAYGKELLTEGAALLRGFARAEVPRLLAVLRDVTEAAPFRHMVTRGGYTMSVAMTSCGTVGWVTDRSGYRYDRVADLLANGHVPRVEREDGLSVVVGAPRGREAGCEAEASRAPGRILGRELWSSTVQRFC
jgi:alkylated DNA repair dioxygenase AlkB